MSNFPKFRRPAEIDFFEVIRDLCYEGFTVYGIAGCIGVPDSTVRHWKLGTHPNYEDGRALVILYEAILNKTAPSKGKQLHIVRSK